MSHSTKLLIGLGVGTLIGVGACWDDGPTVPDLPSPTIMLSDTSVFATGAALAGEMASSSLAAEPEVTYVSLPPGSIPGGVSAVITNRRAQTSATTVMADGGFDPVSIAASSGDTLETVVSRGNASVTLLAIVPTNRAPKLVRTIPPRGKRDVPLNVRISVVFSEPIDPASLTATSLRLLRGSTEVPGRILIGDQGLSVDFVPDAWLSETSEYELVVSENIRDRDGEALGERTMVEFVTQEFTDAIGPIAFSMRWESFVGDSVGPPAGEPWRGQKGSSIYVLENGQVTRLTYSTHTYGTNDGCPKWSPDGLRIAFVSGPQNAPHEAFRVHVMQHDGSDRKMLTNFGAGCPAWSPDGTMLAFSGQLEGSDYNRGIYVMNADGTNIRLLTENNTGDAPTWSPDGRQIAFGGVYCKDYCGVHPDSLPEDAPDNWEADITIVNVDGSDFRRLSSVGEDMGPAWSPDGTTIAFNKAVPSTYESNTSAGGIYAMKADGSHVRKLSSGTRDVSDFCPSWSPDGKMIVFSSRYRDGLDGNHLDIYVMNADGSGIRRMTNSAEDEVCPSWSPARNR